MPERPELPDAVGHIRAAARPTRESQRLTRMLLAAGWPGGPADRTDPVARGWLRMWGPVRIVAKPPSCGCAYGRCTICN